MGAKSKVCTIRTRPSPLEYGEAVRRLLVSVSPPVWSRALAMLEACRRGRRNLFLCGNGGSAANANHLATDLIYGANRAGRGAFRVHSLSANPSILTCLGNDTGFENIFAKQLEALAMSGDLLLVFSGSGNSPNILRVLEAARRLGVTSISFLGFDGGKAKSLSDHVLHFPANDMQVAEDLHMIVAHLLLKHLC